MFQAVAGHPIHDSNSCGVDASRKFCGFCGFLVALSSTCLSAAPGCGKTLLAQAAAAQCGANFIAVRGPELLDKVR